MAAGANNPLAFTAGPLRKFLPLINGGSPTKGNGNISAQLPSIPPAPGPTLPTAKAAGYHASDSGPLSRQMVGTQMLGLAALCAAVGIVLIRFWRRKPHPGLATGAAAAADSLASGSPASGSPAAAATAVGGTASGGAAPGGSRSGWRRFLPGRTTSTS